MASKMTRKCPECGSSFEQKHARQLYCTKPHQIAFNNRQLARGQALVGLGQAWRLGRNTSRPAAKAAAAKAFNALCRLLDDYNAEDMAAGRAQALQLLRVRDAHLMIDLR